MKPGIMMESGQISRGVMVLGMHRSGTSALTRVLNLTGLHLGDEILDAREGNASGHWEPIRVIELNERVLAALGRTWSDPREMPENWQANSSVKALLPEAILLLQQDFAPYSKWSMKDPRLSRLLPFWLEAAKRIPVLELSAVIALRHPWEVASSLNRRDGLPLSQGMLLWLQHTREALRASHGLRRAVIRYEALLADWREELRRLEVALEINLHEFLADGASQAIESFLNIDARHENHLHSSDRVPAPLLGLYERVGRARSEEEIEGAAREADKIVAASEASSHALTDIYVHKERLHARVMALEVAASEVASREIIARDDELRREIHGITQHLLHADWVNQELQKKWHEAEGALQRLRGASEEQAERNRQAQSERLSLIEEKDLLHAQVKSLYAELQLANLRAEHQASDIESRRRDVERLTVDLAARDASWCMRAMRWWRGTR